MTEIGMVLMTVEIPGTNKPGIIQAARAMGVTRDAIDKAFGVVPVDPDRHLYAVQVRMSDVPVKKRRSKSYRGPFANPRIAPFR